MLRVRVLQLTFQRRSCGSADFLIARTLSTKSSTKRRRKKNKSSSTSPRRMNTTEQQYSGSNGENRAAIGSGMDEKLKSNDEEATEVTEEQALKEYQEVRLIEESYFLFGKYVQKYFNDDNVYIDILCLIKMISMIYFISLIWNKWNIELNFPSFTGK